PKEIPDRIVTLEHKDERIRVDDLPREEVDHREEPLLELQDSNIVSNTIDESVRDFLPFACAVEEQWPEELWKAVHDAQRRENDVRSGPSF
ncbi:hypothetical protein, partial [Streptococcus pneumoniae]